VLGLAVACSSEGSATKQQEKGAEPGRKLAGVYPDKFQCDTMAKPEDLTQLLGAVKVTAMVSAFTPPKGVPLPCNYEAVMQDHVEYWTFDFDCRDDMKKRADALFEQYKRTSADNQAQFDHVMDAGLYKPNPDAGPVVIKRPDDAVEVQVGAKGLDHHGQGLIFIDDDAPCYVRVIGPDASHRLALAQLLAKQLTFANAPMTPRPMK
jgi:hypothetical protein